MNKPSSLYCIFFIVLLFIVPTILTTGQSNQNTTETLPPLISTFIGFAYDIQFQDWEWDERKLLIFQPVFMIKESHIQGKLLRVPHLRTLLNHEEVLLYSTYTGVITNGFLCARFIQPRSTLPGQ